MRRRPQALAAVLVLICVSASASASAGESASPGGKWGTARVEKVAFKATYVQDGERVARVRLSADESSMEQVGAAEIVVHSSDSINVQLSVVDQAGESIAVEQAFVRFVNRRTGKDNLFVMRKRGLDIKADVELRREVRDRSFWTALDAYRVQVVVGDVRLPRSLTWVVAESLRFDDAETAQLFEQPQRNVFDFDVGVKTELLPEFQFPLPDAEKRASTPAVVVATVATATPLAILLVAWARLGVFAIDLSRLSAARVGLQTCVLAHMAALVLFWARWDILTTWKAMAGLMVPTLLCVRALVAPAKPAKPAKPATAADGDPTKTKTQ